MNGAPNSWPALPFAEWKDTTMTLHMWTQIVGKIRLTLSPWTNHSWHVTLYVTSRGLTTSPIPHGTRTLEILFDFIDHQLRILTSDGKSQIIELKPQSVAKFYETVMKTLNDLELPVTINMMPNEIATIFAAPTPPRMPTEPIAETINGFASTPGPHIETPR